MTISLSGNIPVPTGPTAGIPVGSDTAYWPQNISSTATYSVLNSINLSGPGPYYLSAFVGLWVNTQGTYTLQLQHSNALFRGILTQQTGSPNTVAPFSNALIAPAVTVAAGSVTPWTSTTISVASGAMTILEGVLYNPGSGSGQVSDIASGTLNLAIQPSVTCQVWFSGLKVIPENTGPVL